MRGGQLVWGWIGEGPTRALGNPVACEHGHACVARARSPPVHTDWVFYLEHISKFAHSYVRDHFSGFHLL